MDEFFFDANDRDKPAHVIGFHDIGGGDSSKRAKKTMSIDDSIMDAIIENKSPVIAYNNNSKNNGSIAHNKQLIEQSGVFFEPTRDHTIVDFKPLPVRSYTSERIDRAIRFATSLGNIGEFNATNDAPAEKDDTSLPTSLPPSPTSSNVGGDLFDESDEVYFSDITEEYYDSDNNDSNKRASEAASQSARDARSASTRAQMAVNRMRNAQKTSTRAAASTAQTAARAARTAATSASLSSTAAMSGRVIKTARDQLEGKQERVNKNYKDMSNLVSKYIKNPAVHAFDDKESEKKVNKLAQTLRNRENAEKTSFRARTMEKIGNIRSWQTNKMRSQMRAKMQPRPRRTSSKVKNSDE